MAHGNGIVKERAHLNTDRKKFEEGYDAIFGKNKKQKNQDKGWNLVDNPKVCRWCNGQIEIPCEHDENMNVTKTYTCDMCDGTGKHIPEKYTCHKCQGKTLCKCAWDVYNTNGDCLLERVI